MRLSWTAGGPGGGRRSPGTRGYGALFSEQVTQANEGCDFEFLARPGSTSDPGPNPQ